MTTTLPTALTSPLDLPSLRSRLEAVGRAPGARGAVLAGAVAAVLSLSLLLASSPVQAQSWRAQGAWVAGHVGGLVVGGEWRRPLGAEPEIPLPLPGVEREGPIVVGTRNWILTGMAAVGVNAAPPDDRHDIRPLVYGHGGILYRTGSSMVSRAGVVGVFYVPAGAVGPAAQLEAAGVIALQGGVLYAERGWMGHGALSVSLRFLCDLVCGGGG